MKRVNKKWFECKAGHITAGDEKPKKCLAEQWQLYYEKGKRKGSWKGEVKKSDKTCGEEIVSEGDLPEELDYFAVWDQKVMHAFLIGQKFDSEFMIGLQTAFKKAKDAINEGA
jgi:hypothetical protein